MDLITTHINSDFDGLGSMVAAKRLYPDSRLFLPGSQEKAVRDFLCLAKGIVKFETERSFDPEGIDRLILVDTRHKPRIGHAGQLVDKGVEVHIYDHHPRMKGDIVADKDVYLEVGATVTIMADLLKKRKITPSYLEATIMLLGIYEETGSLTYRTTTKMDVDMVSFLLSCGANLSAVSSYLNRELTEEELSFLTVLINATERITVKGTHVSLIEVASGEYSGEMGMLIHKLMEIENISVLFVFVKTPGGRISVIARSRLQDVDVNKILSCVGGGGHPTAASAKVQGKDIAELKARLIKALGSSIKVRVYAKDMMNASPCTVSVNENVSRTRDLLMQKGLEGALVMHGKKVAGAATMDRLTRAMRHGFGHARVKGYMSTKVASVGPRAPLHEVKRLILEKDAALIPVMKGGKVAGVINRTDVLRRVHEGEFSKPRSVRRDVVQNLAKRMGALLPKGIMRLLRKIGRRANEHGYSAFVVGGLVRDLVLNVRNLDLDVVIEGDAIRLANVLAKDLRGTLVIHRRFGTASIFTHDGLKIDCATARKEVYEAPAALPTVEFSSLKSDLIRRDFTINAMAVSLNGENFGQLIDFFGGERDLCQGRIKVLHDSSFIDDPTRIFRAVRFEQRFGFRIDTHTDDLIKDAARQEMFDKTETQRIRDELMLIMKEPDPIKALRRMDELHELAFIHPRIRFSAEMERFLGSIRGAADWFEGISFRKRAIDEWILYLMALVDDLSYTELKELCRKFVFTNRDTLRLLSLKEMYPVVVEVLGKERGLAASRAYTLLEPLAYEVILAIMAKTQSARVRKEIEKFFAASHGTRLRMKGDDLKRLGLEPGPQYKKILDKVLHKKIDGYLKTKRDELGCAKGLIASLKR